MWCTVEIDTHELEACGRHIVQELWRGTRDAVTSACIEAPRYALENRGWTNRSGEAERRTRGYLTSLTDAGATGIVESAVHYASYLNDGTRPHEILPLDYHWGSGRFMHPTSRVTGRRAENVTAGAGRGSFLRFTVGGRVVFARMVKHPGTDAYQYMTKAYDKAERVMTREITDSIARAQKWAEAS